MPILDADQNEGGLELGEFPIIDEPVAEPNPKEILPVDEASLRNAKRGVTQTLIGSILLAGIPPLWFGSKYVEIPEIDSLLPGLAGASTLLLFTGALFCCRLPDKARARPTAIIVALFHVLALILLTVSLFASDLAAFLRNNGIAFRMNVSGAVVLLGVCTCCGTVCFISVLEKIANLINAPTLAREARKVFRFGKWLLGGGFLGVILAFSLMFLFLAILIAVVLLVATPIFLVFYWPLLYSVRKAIRETGRD